MRRRVVLTGVLAGPVVLGLIFGALPTSAGAPASEVRWKKMVIDKKFRSEGVGAADVNKDGKIDILAGDVWYEAPDWKMHEIRPIARDYGDGSRGGREGYSESFGCFTDDFNGDGWVDLIVLPFPGDTCYWYENPRNKPGHWKQRAVWRSACNETPLYTDLFGDGKKYLIMAIQPEGQMCWFSVPQDIERPWDVHPISLEKSPGTDRFSHGLGVGDVNGDGRRDVMVTYGWWEQPPDAKNSNKPWTFHKADLGGKDNVCADMYAYDVDGDGVNDVISSSAHRLGIWWHQQIPGTGGSEFKRHDILNRFSQTHALHLTDINGDGVRDLVTGKRWWAHGPKGDVDPNSPAVLYWIEIKTRKGAPPEFVPHEIDSDSGIGTQFVVTDVNGDRLPDIVVANKKGCFLFEQQRAK
jgi:hypothetical protein